MSSETSATVRMCVVLATLVFTSGCAGPGNYTDVAGPRYAGRGHTAASADTIDVVTFNVQFSRRVDLAIQTLRQDPSLRRADLILLQEMDAHGTRAIAHALDLEWVYYPARRSSETGRDFGNAVLSRWPIVADRKVILPHTAIVGGTQRIAVGATVRIGAERLRVYSLHLATQVGNSARARREQLLAVLADADSFPRVILGGDFNSEGAPYVAEARGYTWATRSIPPTSKDWAIDHVLYRGLESVGGRSAGVGREVKGTSDHRAVWVRLRWPS